MMYYRRKIQLALLSQFGGELTAKQFQKLLFLFTRKQDMKSYDFVPFHYGCYSFQASQDIHALATMGHVNITDFPEGHRIFLVDQEDYSTALTLFDQKALLDTYQEFSGMSQDELIRYTYVHFPFYAIKSDIAEVLLSDEEYNKVKKQERHYSDPMLFTIGYEGVSLESYINKLILNDVHTLCDVRKNAFSQKYGFSKSQLKMACEGTGIKYIHFPELGIESDKRQTLKTQEDYDALFDEYEQTTLISNYQYILAIRDIIDKDKRVALTCFEADPKQCHRSRVAKALMQLDNINYKKQDLINA